MRVLRQKVLRKGLNDIDMDQSKSLKQLRNDYKEHGVFYTDSKLAEIIKQFIPADVKEVYDPTCGSGALLSALGDDVVKYGQELNPRQAEETQRPSRTLILLPEIHFSSRPSLTRNSEEL